MFTDRRTANLDKDILHLIFERLQDKVKKRDEEEKHAADRHRRRAIDALRSRIKHLEPPVRITDTWEVVRPLVEKSEEYRALDDEGRQAAFDKVIKRLKEKEDDAEKERERRKPRRSDERDYRNGHRESRRGRLSEPPEADPYEEDRKRAMAARLVSVPLAPPTETAETATTGMADLSEARHPDCCPTIGTEKIEKTSESAFIERGWTLEAAEMSSTMVKSLGVSPVKEEDDVIAQVTASIARGRSDEDGTVEDLGIVVERSHLRSRRKSRNQSVCVPDLRRVRLRRTRRTGLGLLKVSTWA